VCTVPGHTHPRRRQSVSPASVPRSPYFEWLSEGASTAPVFVTRRNGRRISRSSSAPRRAVRHRLPDEGARRLRRRSERGLIVVDAPFDAGYGTRAASAPSNRSPDARPSTRATSARWSSRPPRCRRSARSTPRSGSPSPTRWVTPSTCPTRTAVDLRSEHGQRQPLRQPDGRDVGRLSHGHPIGTHAYNRYAAGWIDPARVAVHASGTPTTSWQRSDQPARRWWCSPPPIRAGSTCSMPAAGPRTTPPLPRSGVEIHEVDTRRDVACAMPAEWPTPGRASPPSSASNNTRRQRESPRRPTCSGSTTGRSSRVHCDGDRGHPRQLHVRVEVSTGHVSSTTTDWRPNPTSRPSPRSASPWDATLRTTTCSVPSRRDPGRDGGVHHPSTRREDNIGPIRGCSPTSPRRGTPDTSSVWPTSGSHRDRTRGLRPRSDREPGGDGRLPHPGVRERRSVHLHRGLLRRSRRRLVRGEKSRSCTTSA
jgi:hypothetical protein